MIGKSIEQKLFYYSVIILYGIRTHVLGFPTCLYVSVLFNTGTQMFSAWKQYNENYDLLSSSFHISLKEDLVYDEVGVVFMPSIG